MRRRCFWAGLSCSSAGSANAKLTTFGPFVGSLSFAGLYFADLTRGADSLGTYHSVWLSFGGRFGEVD